MIKARGRTHNCPLSRWRENRGIVKAAALTLWATNLPGLRSFPKTIPISDLTHPKRWHLFQCYSRPTVPLSSRIIYQASRPYKTFSLKTLLTVRPKNILTAWFRTTDNPLQFNRASQAKLLDKLVHSRATSQWTQTNKGRWITPTWVFQSSWSIPRASWRTQWTPTKASYYSVARFKSPLETVH